MPIKALSAQGHYAFGTRTDTGQWAERLTETGEPVFRESSVVTLKESLGLADTVSKDSELHWQDSIGLEDALQSGHLLQFFETIGLIESDFKKTISKTWIESLGITDHLHKTGTFFMSHARSIASRHTIRSVVGRAKESKVKRVTKGTGEDE